MMSMRDPLKASVFKSRIRSDHVTGAERWLGHLLGPFAVMLMNSILSNYLNVYYTDVMNIGHIWGGAFLSLFPLVVKALDALTFVLMGMIIDRWHSGQGKARPWILFSAPLLSISMTLLFVVPTNADWLTALWIFLSYNLFYSVAYTAYSTAHTLMVPLATADTQDRSKLSINASMQGMLSGMLVAVIFPTKVIPAIGTNRNAWMTIMTAVAVVALPFILMEYWFTRERVTEQGGIEKPAPHESLSLKAQARLCVKSRTWCIFFGYLALSHLVQTLFSTGTFYYCNWVLGSYNDGITQMLFYAIGNGLLGPALFIVRPLCKRLGLRNALIGGFLIAALGSLICWLQPQSLPVVLTGQVVRSIGMIPATFMGNVLLADALDDVERITGHRCDGFTSSLYNVLLTLSTGLAMFILNTGLSAFRYISPAGLAEIPVQGVAVKSFITFCVVGLPTIVYPLIAFVFHFQKNNPKTGSGQ